MQINNAIVAQAEVDAGKSGYDTSHYFSLQLDANGNTEVVDTDADSLPDNLQSTSEKEPIKKVSNNWK